MKTRILLTLAFLLAVVAQFLTPVALVKSHQNILENGKDLLFKCYIYHGYKYDYISINSSPSGKLPYLEAIPEVDTLKKRLGTKSPKESEKKEFLSTMSKYCLIAFKPDKDGLSKLVAYGNSARESGYTAIIAPICYSEKSDSILAGDLSDKFFLSSRTINHFKKIFEEMGADSSLSDNEKRHIAVAKYRALKNRYALCDVLIDGQSLREFDDKSSLR